LQLLGPFLFTPALNYGDNDYQADDKDDKPDEKQGD
jgi:hypothetical protein